MESPFNQIALRSPFFDTGVSAFTPLSLFSSGEVGAWYDPSDMSTMFQDAGGTIPVTAVEQPVSLILDKSKSLAAGPDVITNGTFSSNTWWGTDAGWAITGGQAVATASTGQIYSPDPTVSANKTYRVSVDVVSYTSGTFRIVAGNAQVDFAPVSGQTYVAYLTTTTNGRIRFGGANSFTGAIDNVTAVEIAGNHAYTPSAATASRPVLSARYNLLTKTEQFDDAVWTKTSVTVSTNQTTAPDGTTTADLIAENTGTDLHQIYPTISLTAGASYLGSFFLKKGNGATAPDWVRLAFRSGGMTTAPWANFNINTGTIGNTSGAGITASITAISNGWYRCSIMATANASTSSGGAYVQLTNNQDTTNPTNNNSYAGSTTSNIYIWGADLRVANDGVGLPVYQRVNTSTDYDTTNFPMYLRFDGSDDYMLTGTITPGTDKAQVFAGVRKFNAVGTTSVLTELSASRSSNNGAFTVVAPGLTEQYAFVSKGTSDSAAGPTSTVYAAPNTSVLTGIGDISGDNSLLRLNAVQVSQNTGDQGTGNYLAYPLYIGRRGGTTAPFNGRIFGLIVRFGANLSATQITNTETWMNGKTKAY